MGKVNLLLVFHCHQPVGNFNEVFKEAYDKAYLPFIEAFSQRPKIKFAIHYSGSLLDWLKERHPEFLSNLKRLVNRGQIELLTAGYYEPILPVIPQRDAKGQLKMHQKALSELFGYEAIGAWLTERVWEPKLPQILSESGIKYTIVDDSHFKLLSMDPERVSGYYYSDDESGNVGIFAGSEKLRYLIPFKAAQETINYLKMRLVESKEDLAITFADDGEKFGLWPGTYKWVYTDGWLNKFLSALEENSEWLKTQTLGEYFRNNPATGRVYIPCASYREMLEWSEGYFRNFFVRYIEADNMHKKMLYVSDKVNQLASSPVSRLGEVRQELYKGQANDAYWHGVFGGLYLNHLRSSVYNHLIAAENLIDRNSSKVEEIDFNLDGEAEVILKNQQHCLNFSPKSGAALFEWDFRPKAINLTNAIMRRFEKYHQRLKEKANPVKETAGPLSIHDLSLIKGDISSRLHYDSNPRYSLLEHFLEPGVRLEDFVASNFPDKVLSSNKRFDYEIISREAQAGVRFYKTLKIDRIGLEIDKVVALDKNIQINYELRNTDTQKFSSMFGVEFNLSIYSSRLSKEAGVIRDNHIIIEDSWYGLKVRFDFQRDALIWHFPVETISESESGIEKTYQELCLLFQWEVNILPKLGWKMGMNINVE